MYKTSINLFANGEVSMTRSSMYSNSTETRASERVFI
jgi:hypothetical protein